MAIKRPFGQRDACRWPAAIDVATASNGVAVCRTSAGTFVYVANVGGGTIDVLDCHHKPLGSFTDPTLPDGYAPFDLQIVDGILFVTLVHRDTVRRADSVEPEHGFIAEFSLDGEMLDRAAFGRGSRYGAGRHRPMQEPIEEGRRRRGLRL